MIWWKCFVGLSLQVFLLNAFVINRDTLVPDEFVRVSVNLSKQHPEVMSGLFEGDIALTNDDYQALKLGTNFQKFPQTKWPNRTVPYVISNLYSSADMIAINKAIRTLNYLSCLQFKPRKNENDTILIYPVALGCFSYVGRRGGVQVLSLKGTDKPEPSCLRDEGTPIHELMHAAGILHEQSRADRDEYVEIIYENIIPAMKSNFAKHPFENATYLYEYDYDSLMHYGRNYFAVDLKKPTIISKMNPKKKLGQRKGLTKIDCFKLNALYGCFDDKKTAKKYKNRCHALNIDA